jgi:hypothetical protein
MAIMLIIQVGKICAPQAVQIPQVVIDLEITPQKVVFQYVQQIIEHLEILQEINVFILVLMALLLKMIPTEDVLMYVLHILGVIRIQEYALLIQ